MWHKLAPEVIFSYASFALKIPPTPMIVNFPLVLLYTCLTTLVAILCNGSPLIAPFPFGSNPFAVGYSSGRCSVLNSGLARFVQTTPSIPNSTQASTIVFISSIVMSAASFTYIGLSVIGRILLLIAVSKASRLPLSTKGSPSCVFGQLIFTVK